MNQNHNVSIHESHRIYFDKLYYSNEAPQNAHRTDLCQKTFEIYK